MAQSLSDKLIVALGQLHMQVLALVVEREALVEELAKIKEISRGPVPGAGS